MRACASSIVRVLTLASVALAPAACLTGPSAALGGGPIGRAPNLRETELLRVPDSTRGEGFVIRANRRDLLEESRVELNAAARAYQRMFGVLPEDADIRLVSDEANVEATIRVGARPPSTFSIALRSEQTRARLPEATRVAMLVVLASSRAWLAGTIHELAPTDASGTPWMERTQLPAWLRTGVLQNVAVNPFHELWMVQLGRERETLPTVAELFGTNSCDAACLAPFTTLGSDGSTNDGEPAIGIETAPPLPASGRFDPGRGRVPPLQGSARYAAATYSLVQFIAKREGPDFMRALVASALAGRDVREALGAARTFTADPSDIDRQWRVWLATFAYPEG